MEGLPGTDSRLHSFHGDDYPPLLLRPSLYPVWTSLSARHHLPARWPCLVIARVHYHTRSTLLHSHCFVQQPFFSFSFFFSFSSFLLLQDRLHWFPLWINARVGFSIVSNRRIPRICTPRYRWFERVCCIKAGLYWDIKFDFEGVHVHFSVQVCWISLLMFSDVGKSIKLY